MMAKHKKEDEEVTDAEEILGTFLKGDRLDDTDRYKAAVENIYRKLRPLWLDECKDAVWLLRDELVREVAEIIYLDDQMGGSLDSTSLSDERQKLLAWKQVRSVVERYRAMDYSLVDNDTAKAVLSSIIKNKGARDADRLKAIELYLDLFNGDQIEGITFVNDIGKKLKEKKRLEEESEESSKE